MEWWHKKVHFFTAPFMAILILCLSSCSDSSEIENFTSDGCSLFPDRAYITKHDWCHCCYEHDLAYWQGGTKVQRIEADEDFRTCVSRAVGNESLAQIMYTGVRLGGNPYWFTWFRWGYGWDYGRGYKVLTEQEHQLVALKYKQYLAESPSPVCKE